MLPGADGLPTSLRLGESYRPAMPNDEPTPAEIIVAATEGSARGTIGALIDPVTDFLSTLLGPATAEFGGWAGDLVRFMRWKWRVKMLGRAEEILKQAGLPAQEVPLHVLMPILDTGANEERPDMQERWANLLANAASRANDVPASFATVLSDLEPEEARILEHVYDVMLSIALEAREHDLGLFRLGIAKDLNLPAGHELEYHLDNLIRLRLVREPTGAVGSKGDTVTLSEFGRRFVRACRSPTHPDPPIRFSNAADVKRQAAENRRRWESSA